MEDKELELEIDLLELFHALMKNIVMIVASTILFAAVGFGVSKFLMTPQYEASVNMIVNTRSEGATNVTNDNITSAKNMVSTYAIIIKSNTVLNEVVDKLQLEMKYKELAEKVTVGAVDATQVMRVAVQDPDPQLAVQIVAQIADIAPGAIPSDPTGPRDATASIIHPIALQPLLLSFLFLPSGPPLVVPSLFGKETILRAATFYK